MKQKKLLEQIQFESVQLTLFSRTFPRLAASVDGFCPHSEVVGVIEQDQVLDHAVVHVIFVLGDVVVQVPVICILVEGEDVLAAPEVCNVLAQFRAENWEAVEVHCCQDVLDEVLAVVAACFVVVVAIEERDLFDNAFDHVAPGIAQIQNAVVHAGLVLVQLLPSHQECLHQAVREINGEEWVLGHVLVRYYDILLCPLYDLVSYLEGKSNSVALLIQHYVELHSKV